MKPSRSSSREINVVALYTRNTKINVAPQLLSPLAELQPLLQG
jgi:hypothetical protein